MTAPVLAGAEPFSAEGGRAGVLVVHGFTGSPQSMRPLAEAFATAGFTVELPLLPGHGTSVDDMATTGWDDWSAAAEVAYTELASRCERVVLAGLSMGGTICCWLASRHPDVAGVVVVNPAVEPPGDGFVDILDQTLAQGIEIAPAVGGDIADPTVAEASYDAVPIRALRSLALAQQELFPQLGEIRSPVLVMTSRNDHVVPPSSSDVLAERVSGPVERVWLERSYHVATIDYDREEVATRAVDFARKVCHL